MASTHKEWVLYMVPVCAIFVMLENHYTRDAVGALEKQLESDLGMTAEQYSTLNSLYFLPNIVLPLLIGVMCELSGRASMLLLYNAMLLATGNILFVLGARYGNLTMFYAGRFLAGCVYEVIDTIPIIILGPLFRSNWGLMVGIMNGCLRLGTVFAFSLSPILYRNYGVEAALWMSTLMSVIGVAFAAGGYFADCYLNNTSAINDVIDDGEGDGFSECEMAPLTHDHASINIHELNGAVHVPTRKSIEYYQAMQAQLDNDPLASPPSQPYGTVPSISMPTTDCARQPATPPSSTTAATRTQRLLSHESAGHPSPPHEEPCSPLGTRFTSRNISLLHAEANTMTHRKRIFSQDAADSGEFEDSANSRSEDTPLLAAALHLPGGNNGTFNTDAADGPLKSKDAQASTWEYLLSLSPFQDFGVQYYFYLLNSVCIFGAMVPFWFLGSKFLQLNYGMQVEHADFLMLLPEGAMVFIAPTLGLVLDRLGMSLRKKLYLLAAVCFGMMSAFFALAGGYNAHSSNESAASAAFWLDPLYSMLVLSCCYACANSLTWDVVIEVVPHPDQLAPATGLAASAVNLLPCVIPYVIIGLTRYFKEDGGGVGIASSGMVGEESQESSIGMIVLAGSAALAGAFAVGAAWCKARTYDAELLQQTSLGQESAEHDEFARNASNRDKDRYREERNRSSCGSEYEII